MNVMLLAAGEGTRLRPHTLVLPKPSIPFLGIPLISYPLAFLNSIKIDQLVVNTFHLPEKIITTLKQLPPSGTDLIFSAEKGEILGSGGGLKKAEKFFKGQGDFILMNADEVILPKDKFIFEKACTFHQESKSLATLLVMKYPGVGTKFGGVWTKGSDVLGFGKTALPGSETGWHFIGPQILSEEVFSFLPPQGPSNILYDGLAQAIAAGKKVSVYPIDCEWFETGNEKDFLEATKICLDFLAHDKSEGKYLNEVLNTFAPQPFHFRTEKFAEKSVQILSAKNSVVSANAKLSGFSVLSEGVRVGAGCELKNVIVGPYVHLPDHSSFADQIILAL